MAILYSITFRVTREYMCYITTYYVDCRMNLTLEKFVSSYAYPLNIQKGDILTQPITSTEFAT